MSLPPCVIKYVIVVKAFYVNRILIAAVLPLNAQEGATPALIAAENNHVEALELLCKHGADVNKARQASSETL